MRVTMRVAVALWLGLAVVSADAQEILIGSADASAVKTEDDCKTDKSFFDLAGITVDPHARITPTVSADLRWYFPQPPTVQAKREALDIIPVTRNYLTLWLDHGRNPAQASDDYVIPAGATAEQAEAYAAAPAAEVAIAPKAQSAALTTQTFVERFTTDAPPPECRLTTNPKTNGLRWHKPGERPGVHFEARTTEAYLEGGDRAVWPWPMGTQPFELRFDVNIDKGRKQTFFEPGVMVVLATALPEDATDDDLAIVVHVHYAGVGVALWRKGWGWADKRPQQISKTTGGPDNLESATWVDAVLAPTLLRVRVARDAQHNVTFEIDNNQQASGAVRPWCRKEATIPAALAGKPLRYLIVERVPVKKGHVGYPGFVLAGSVGDIQARAMDGPAFPVVTGWRSEEPAPRNGSTIALTGEHLDRGAKVFLASRQAHSQWLSGRELRVRLPALADATVHPLTVVNGSGLFASLEGGLPYGRTIQRVEPREALPAGGEVVTIVGSGFDEATKVQIGQADAPIVQRIDARAIQVRVPPGKAGPAAVSARSGDEPFAGTPLFGYSPHPYLVVRGEELPDLRKKFNEPAFADYRTLLLRQADEAMQLKLPVDNEPFNRLAGPMDNLLWAYLYTQKPAYREKALAIAAQIAAQRQSVDFHTMCFGAMGRAYDGLFADLDGPQRMMFQEYLDYAVRCYDRAGGDWFYNIRNNPSNTVAVSNGGAGQASLALMHSTPLAAKGAQRAHEQIKTFCDVVLAPDGGCVEGTLYWNYGLGHYLLFASAYRNAIGEDGGLLSHPNLERNWQFAETVLAGDGLMLTFNDTQPWLTGLPVCALLEAETDNPLVRWLSDAMVREALLGGRQTTVQHLGHALAWRTRKPALAQCPPLPTVSILEEMHWGMMRSDGAYIPKAAVGVKGQQGRLSHHKQEDLGSFVYYANGENYLIDPGYYQPKATDHTLPLIDGAGPHNLTGSSIIASGQKNARRWMVVDSLHGYNAKAPVASRVRRTIVLEGACAVVLDDVLPADGKPGKITAQYQAAFAAQLGADKRSAVVQGKAGRMLLATFGPAIELAATGPKDFGRSWIYKRMAERGEVAWHAITGDYQADAANPLVTVLVPAAGQDNPQPAKYQREAGGITVTLPGDAVVQFVRKNGVWEMSPQ